jgi:arsenate reductase
MSENRSEAEDRSSNKQGDDAGIGAAAEGGAPMDEITVFFNPKCSKCRTAHSILDERGVDATSYRYLEQAPSRDELERVMGLLGIDDPRQMMRTGEDVYKELNLKDASGGELLDAMAANPILIERPIVIKGDKAVIARPPERALEIL